MSSSSQQHYPLSSAHAISAMIGLLALLTTFQFTYAQQSCIDTSRGELVAVAAETYDPGDIPEFTAFIRFGTPRTAKVLRIEAADTELRSTQFDFYTCPTAACETFVRVPTIPRQSQYSIGTLYDSSAQYIFTRPECGTPAKNINYQDIDITAYDYTDGSSVPAFEYVPNVDCAVSSVLFQGTSTGIELELDEATTIYAVRFSNPVDARRPQPGVGPGAPPVEAEDLPPHFLRVMYSMDDVVFHTFKAQGNCTGCADGLFGTNCTQFSWTCRTERCNGHGECTGQTSGCVCDPGYNQTANCSTVANASLVLECPDPADFGATCAQNASECAADRCGDLGDCVGTKRGCNCAEGEGKAYFVVKTSTDLDAFKRQPLTAPRAAKYIRVRFREVELTGSTKMLGEQRFFFELYANGTAWDALGIQTGTLGDRAVTSSDWGAGHSSCWRVKAWNNIHIPAEPGCPFGAYESFTELRWVMVELPGPNTTVVTGIGIFHPSFYGGNIDGTGFATFEKSQVVSTPKSIFVEYSNDTLTWVSASGFDWLTIEDNCDNCGPSFFRVDEEDLGLPCNVTAEACGADRCSSHGLCYRHTNGTILCSCDYPYTGANCSTCSYAYGGAAHDPCRKCPDGFFGDDCDVNATDCATARCNGQGYCTGELLGCACNSDYRGAACDVGVAAASGPGGCEHPDSTMVSWPGVAGAIDNECTCSFTRGGEERSPGKYFLAEAELTADEYLHTDHSIPVWDETQQKYVSRDVYETPIAKMALLAPAINATSIRVVLHRGNADFGGVNGAGLRLELYSCSASGGAGAQNCTANGFHALGMASGSIQDSQIWGSNVPSRRLVSPPHCVRANQRPAKRKGLLPGRVEPTDKSCYSAGFIGITQGTYPVDGQPLFIQVDLHNKTSVYAIGIQAAALIGEGGEFTSPSYVYPTSFSVYYRTSDTGAWTDTVVNQNCSLDVAAFEITNVSGRVGDAVECSQSRCNYHGWCIGHTYSSGCACEPGYNGTHCEFCHVNATVCGHCAEEGKYGPTCNESLAQCSARRCFTDGGSCTGEDEESGCTCGPTYFGAKCNLTAEQCATTLCGGDGTCVQDDRAAENAHCECEAVNSTQRHQIPGWDASDASVAAAALKPALHIFDTHIVARYFVLFNVFVPDNTGDSNGISLRFELYQARTSDHGDRTLEPLGMESGAISDGSLKAYDEDERAFGVPCARLNQLPSIKCPNGGWLATSDEFGNHYVIIDFHTPTRIDAIAVQRATVLDPQGDGPKPYRSGPFELFYSNTTKNIPEPADTSSRNNIYTAIKSYWYPVNTHPDCEHCAVGLYGEHCNITASVCAEERCSSKGACMGETVGCSCAEGYAASTNCETCVDTTGELCSDTPGARLVCNHIGKFGVDSSVAPTCNLTTTECANQRCLGRGHCIDAFHGCECSAGFGSGLFYAPDEADDGDDVILHVFPKPAKHVTHLRFSVPSDYLSGTALRVEAYTCADLSCETRTAIGLANHSITPDTYFTTSITYQAGSYPWCARLGRDFRTHPQTAAEASNPQLRCTRGAFATLEILYRADGLVVRLPAGSGGVTVGAVAVQGDPRVSAQSIESVPEQLYIEYSTDNGATWHPASPEDCGYCKPHLYGPQCDETLEHCTTTHCTSATNGHCTSRAHPDHPVCECKSGYFGFNCELTAEECGASRCSGAGNCTGQLTGCHCNSTTFGPTCLLNLEQCSAVHCGNGSTAYGICTSIHSECLCNSTTHDPAKECTACYAGFNLTASAWPNCTHCKRGLFGAACELTAAQCKVHRCANLSECTGRTRGCAGGVLHETELDACGPHGEVEIGGDACDCNPGYVESTDPDFDLMRCVLPCANGKYNFDLDRCDCPPTHNGRLCDTFVPSVTEADDTQTAVIASVVGVAVVAFLALLAMTSGTTFGTTTAATTTATTATASAPRYEPRQPYLSLPGEDL